MSMINNKKNWPSDGFLQQHIHHANFLHRPPEMASLPAGRPRSENTKKEKRKNGSSNGEEKRKSRRKSRGGDEDQPEMKPDRPQFMSFGMVPTKPQTPQQKQLAHQQQQQQQQHSEDVESMVSGYVYTGMDRDIAEEFILHSMTIQQPSSVKSGNTKRDVFWMQHKRKKKKQDKKKTIFFYRSRTNSTQYLS